MAFYRGRYIHHQMERGASIPTWRKPRNCADARFLAQVWAKRAYRSRQQTGLWRQAQASLALHDFTVTPGSRAWVRAVREVQKVYPGTDSWLMSCSASEGGWGRWVGYSGVPFSQSLIDSDTVGGWLQFRPSTFSGMNRHAIEEVSSKGFRIPESASSWLSPLGQALAGGYAATHGMYHHWSGSGCR